MPTASGATFVEVVVALGAALVGLYYLLATVEKGRSLLSPGGHEEAEKKATGRYVKQEEFDRFRDKLLEEVKLLDGQSRREIGALRDSLQAVLLRIERLVTLEEVRHGRGVPHAEDA